MSEADVPVASNRDPDASSGNADESRQERAYLRELSTQPWPTRMRGYLRLSGPGWLQSAITLGGGSLGSSLYLGVLGGFSLLWLQPAAMLMGIVMLSAIAYVTLSTGERPFRAINVHVNPVLGWGWALATLAANMVWALPQYSLATGVLQQNLLPNVLGADGALGDFRAKLLIAVGILVSTTLVTWAYDSGSWGIRLYERLLKLLVAGIVVCFFGVVARMAFSQHGLPWGELWRGFIPDLSTIFKPAPGYAPLLGAIDESHRAFWRKLIVAEQRDVMISAAATAVGINMTFLLPYSMLARRWGREHRGLALFDLSTGMFIPYVLATSCVVIAAAQQFHPALRDRDGAIATWNELEGKSRTVAEDRLLLRLLGPEEFNAFKNEENELRSRADADADEAIARRRRELLQQVPDAEKQLAAATVRRDAFDLAKSLRSFTGATFADYIFGLGVLGMTLSTITLLMLISGFVICEMLGLPPEGWPHRLGCLAAASGALGPFFWKEAAFYLVVPTSVFGYMLIPIAYLTFFLLMNQRSLLGDDLPAGGRRLLWNTLMGLAAGVTTVASLASVWLKAGWYGMAAVGAFLGAALIVQVARRGKPSHA